MKGYPPRVGEVPRREQYKNSTLSSICIVADLLWKRNKSRAAIKDTDPGSITEWMVNVLLRLCFIYVLNCHEDILVLR